MSFAYGTGNGPIKNLTVDGLYLHRVTQPDGIIYAPNEDGGLIMDWFRWSSNTQDPNSKKKGGYDFSGCPGPPAIFSVDGLSRACLCMRK